MKHLDIVIATNNKHIIEEYKELLDKYDFNKLYNIGKKYSNYCKFSFIYDREGLISLKDSPTDKGEEIFKTLLNKRVEVH